MQIGGAKGKGGAGQPSGYVGGNKAIQVFFNGKIVTPQSLAPKKGQTSASKVKQSSLYVSSLPTANEDEQVNSTGLVRKKDTETKQKLVPPQGKKVIFMSLPFFPPIFLSHLHIYINVHTGGRIRIRDSYRNCY